MVRMLSVVLLASLLVVPCVQGQDKPLRPQAPEDSMRKLVAALVSRDIEKAKQAFISKTTYDSVLPKGGPTHSALSTRFEQSVRDFLAQQQPVERMQFVRINYEFCPQPMIAPKGFSGFQAMCVMYDNLRVIVEIEGSVYSFKVDALIAADDKWALLDGIELLKPYRERG